MPQLKQLQQRLFDQLADKSFFRLAESYALDYIDKLPDMRVFPSEEAVDGLKDLDENMPLEPAAPAEILRTLHKIGAPATVAQSGGRYFGFVNGGLVPAAIGVKWLTDVWDQNCAMYVQSPIASRLEDLCEKWLVDLLGLPQGTAAGFVSGSATAITCGLAAARDTLLARQGWDVKRQGLRHSPPLRVLLGEQAHSTVYRALSLLGFGRDEIETIPCDGQGRLIAAEMPEMDDKTLFIAQAGNVNSGCFDPLDDSCDRANRAGAWVHIDGAFGIWAAASGRLKHLTRGLDKADSWSADAHKALNAPYDCGIVFCRDRQALAGSLQMAGSYLVYSEQRDGMLYTPEMSRRARGIELWAVLKSLGRSGVSDLIEQLRDNAVYLAGRLSENGFEVLNEVVFNQVLVRAESPDRTGELLKTIQAGGRCWCGGATWQNQPVIRLSVCSWQTTQKDLDVCVDEFVRAGKLSAY